MGREGLKEKEKIPHFPPFSEKTPEERNGKKKRNAHALERILCMFFFIYIFFLRGREDGRCREGK